jgi:hypothetical protein
MATGIPIKDDIISTSDISDIVRTRQRRDKAGDWDKEDSEPSHKGRKITGSKNGKVKGSSGTLFDGTHREAVEELEKSINSMDSYFDDEVPVSSFENLPLQNQVKERIPFSLEVRKKDRIAVNARKRAAERKSTTSMSPLISSKSGSHKGKWSLSGNGGSESEPDMLHDSSTSISSKSASRRIRSVNGNMKSASAPSGEKVKLELSSPRRNRRSPGRTSRRERKSPGLHPSSSDSPAGSTSRMDRGKGDPTPGAGHPQTMQAIPILTQSTHSVESARIRDSTDDDSNANADALQRDAGIEDVAKDHDRQQKTETVYSQPSESSDASLKSKSARIPSNDLSKLLSKYQSPTSEITLGESSMPSLDISTLHANAAAIRAEGFEKQHIAKISGGLIRIDDLHYSTKNGERDEERSGLKSISSLDSSELENSPHAPEELLQVDTALEAGWHPVLEQDSLKSSARRNDEKITYPQHETEKRRKDRPTLLETLAHGKKNALNISLHSGDSSINESSKMEEEGPIVMVPVLQKSSWLPAVEEEHDATQLPTADTVISSSKRQFDSDDNEVAENEKLELASDSFSTKRVADSMLKKAAMKYVTDNGNLNDSYPPTNKSVGDHRKVIPSIDGTLPGEPQIDLESESGWHGVPVGQSAVAHGKHLQQIDRPSMGSRSPKLGNRKRPEGPLSFHGSQTEEMEEGDEIHMSYQVGDFSNLDNQRPCSKLKTIEGRSGIEKLRNRLIKEEMNSTQKSTEGGRKETKCSTNNGSPRHSSRSAKAGTHSDTDDYAKVATSFAEASPSQEEYGTTNESFPSKSQGPAGSGPLDTRPTGLFLETTLRKDKSELAGPPVNTTTETSECYKSETESSGEDKDKKGDSDVHALQSMPANTFNSASTVQRKLGGPGLPQGHDDSPGGRSIQSLDLRKGLQQATSHKSVLRQKVNCRREVLTSMLQATTKKTHSTENELLDLKRKLASSQALVQQLEVENAQIRRQAILDVARVQMIVQTKRHSHETELESQIKELIIERSVAVQESHELRMIIMDSCAACQNRLPDREFEMDDSVRRTITERRSVRLSSAFEWLAGNLSEEAHDLLEEAPSAASWKHNSKGRRSHDGSDTYSLTSTLPDTGSIARSNLPTFGEAPLHWLSSKILKKGGQEKDGISESDLPMIERVITYKTVSADANGDEHQSSSSVHDDGKDSANAVKTSDTGNTSSVDPKLPASASVPTNSCTSDSKTVEGYLAADKKSGGSFALNGSVSGEQASKSKHVFGQVPQPAKKNTSFGSLLGEKAIAESPSLLLQAEHQTKIAKEKQTTGKGRFSLFGRLMAEQVEDDFPLLPGNAAAVKPILQDKPENGISNDSDHGKGGKTAAGAAPKEGVRLNSG